MDWNDESIGRLRQFWADGHSTAEIGRRMGVTKNAVVGKAHRLELPARPSPIRRAADGSAPPRLAVPRRTVGFTLPSLSGVPATPVPEAKPTPNPVPIARVATPAARAPVATPALRAVAARSTRSVPCCWPIGEPGTKSFRFCDADATGGKPYCTEHAQIAYVRVRDRREEAA